MVRSDIFSGNEVIVLLAIFKLVRFVNVEILSGNDVILLLARFTVINHVRSPISVGILPTRLFPEKFIAVTRSLVQVIPVHAHTSLKSPRLVLLVQLFPLVALKSCTNAIQSDSLIPVAQIHIPVSMTIATLPHDFCGLYVIV